MADRSPRTWSTRPASSPRPARRGVAIDAHRGQPSTCCAGDGFADRYATYRPAVNLTQASANARGKLPGFDAWRSGTPWPRGGRLAAAPDRGPALRLHRLITSVPPTPSCSRYRPPRVFELRQLAAGELADQVDQPGSRRSTASTGRVGDRAAQRRSTGSPPRPAASLFWTPGCTGGTRRRTCCAGRRRAAGIHRLIRGVLFGGGAATYAPWLARGRELWPGAAEQVSIRTRCRGREHVAVIDARTASAIGLVGMSSCPSIRAGAWRSADHRPDGRDAVVSRCDAADCQQGVTGTSNSGNSHSRPAAALWADARRDADSVVSASCRWRRRGSRPRLAGATVAGRRGAAGGETPRVVPGGRAASTPR